MTAHHEYSSSPRHYEREAEATRYRLASSLDELSSRLTVGQVLDEMLTYAKGSGGTFLRALSTASRENPIPSLLIGAGCMMFLSEKMGLNRYLSPGNGDDRQARGNGTYDRGSPGVASRAADGMAASARSAAEAVRSGVRQTTDYAAEKASSLVDEVKHGAAAVGDTISSAQRGITETAGELGEQVSNAVSQGAGVVHDLSSSVGEQVAETADEATRVARQAKHAAASFINEQPLLCAAIGLAIGAAIGAMIPSTEAEDELMGETSDAVKDAVGEVASEELETVKEAAGKVAEEAKSAAEREGLTASAAADIAASVGEKLKRVVTETGETASNQVRDFKA
jgi:ElaB/YqjD/DUF883 family membrane-anchored ribosome-binding protein